MLEQVLADLATEGDELAQLVSQLPPDQWRTPTPAPGWDIATTIAHLAWTDEVAVKAATDKAAWDEEVLNALADPSGFVDKVALAGAAAPVAELLARWQEARALLAKTLAEREPGEKLMWFGPPMSPTSMATARFMETWAHGLDVRDALDVAYQPSDRIKHVVHLGVRTRDYSFVNHQLQPPTALFHVELRAPSGEIWQWGPADAEGRVSGSAYDFARLVTQRIHRDDTDLVTSGDLAEEWLSIAQAFAGPAGGGRAAQQQVGGA